MRTDWSSPPEDASVQGVSSLFSFCKACHFVRLKTLIQGFVSLQIAFQSTDSFILYVQSYDDYYYKDDQSFYFYVCFCQLQAIIIIFCTCCIDNCAFLKFLV